MLRRARSFLGNLRFLRDILAAASYGFVRGLARGIGARILEETEAERRAKNAWKGWDEDDLERELAGWTNIVACNEPVDIGAFRSECGGMGTRPFAGTVLDLDDPANASFIERRRQQFVEDQVLPRRFAVLAQAHKATDPIAVNRCMLPRVGDGGVHMDLAGPLMYAELPAARFMVIALLGVQPELATAIAKRLLNEWHDLEPHAGLTDDELDLLRVERTKETSAP